MIQTEAVTKHTSRNKGKFYSYCNITVVSIESGHDFFFKCYKTNVNVDIYIKFERKFY